MNVKRGILAAALVAAVAVPVAWAAGNWSTLPIVGGSSFCAAIVGSGPTQGGITGQGAGALGGSTICAQTVPAGPPALTGAETIPADTNAAGGASPQTVNIPVAALGNNPNLLIGGDFATNLWQRGTTPISAGTPTTATIGADRWAVYSSGNTVTVTKQTGAGDSVASAGLLASMRVNRPSGTDVTQICTGQILDKQAAAPLIGKNGVFSFYALAGAGFNAAVTASNITVTIAYWTAADSATPLANTDTFMKGTITGYTAAAAGVSNGTTGAVASGIATIPISTTWTRYGVYAPIPATNAAGTAVTGVGVKVCYTPAAGTTGGATEWVELAGAQLQAMPSTAGVTMSAGVISPTAFQFRAPADEALLQYRYTWGPGQEIAGVNTGVFALCVSTGVVNIGFQPPVPMYIEPTTATSTLTAGTWSIQTAAAVTGLGTITITAAASDNRLITMNSNAACTTTLPYTLVGGAGATGLLLFVAEP